MPTEAQIIGGHKANLHNPNTSAEAKEHSKDVLREEHNGKTPHFFDETQADDVALSRCGRQQDQGPRPRHCRSQSVSHTHSKR